MKKKVLGLLIISMFIIGTFTCYANSNENDFDGTTLDYGIYWFGLNNISQKFVETKDNEYYDPTKPTVIYVHGWLPGTISKLNRPSFEFEGVNVADAWIEEGWNIGIFYWDQFSDESNVKDAEAKIWSVDGTKGMRWLDVNGKHHTDPLINVGAGELFYQEYIKALSGYEGDNIRIVGASLGTQMAIRVSELIEENIESNNILNNLLPTRVALLDPFLSKRKKAYLDDKTNASRAKEAIIKLKDKNVIFEQYKFSRMDNLLPCGDSNNGLRELTAFTNVRGNYISPLRIIKRHKSATKHYFLSFNYEPPKECKGKFSFIKRRTENVAASASTPDNRIREMMNSPYYWDQVKGKYTLTSADDWFKRKNK